MVQILTEEELIAAWKLKSDRELKVFRRWLQPNLPKRVCPIYIDPRDIINIGGVRKFYFDPDKNRPRRITKPS